MTATAQGMLGDAKGCCAAVAIIQAGLGRCFAVEAPRHILS